MKCPKRPVVNPLYKTSTCSAHETLRIVVTALLLCSQLVIHVCTGLERGLEKGLEKGLQRAGEELCDGCDRWGAVSGREVGQGIREAGQGIKEAGQGIKHGKRCLYDQVNINCHDY